MDVLVEENIITIFERDDYWRSLITEMHGEDIIIEIEYDYFHEVPLDAAAGTLYSSEEMFWGWVYHILTLTHNVKDESLRLEKFEHFASPMYTEMRKVLKLKMCSKCENALPNDAVVEAKSIKPKLSCIETSRLILTAYAIYQELLVISPNFTRKAIDLLTTKLDTQSTAGFDMFMMMGLLGNKSTSDKKNELIQDTACGTFTALCILTPCKETKAFRTYISGIAFEDQLPSEMKEKLGEEFLEKLECTIL